MADTTTRGAGETGGARIGRPLKEPNTTAYWETPLHALLLKRMGEVKPPVIQGERIDTKALAQACGVARYTVYRWFQLPNISPKAAARLIGVSKGTLTKQDMFPFLFD